MTFTATGASSVELKKVEFEGDGTLADISLEYSYDEFKTDPIPYTIGNTISLSDGQSVSMRAVSTNDTIGSSLINNYQFVMSGSIAASGNIQSLLDKTCQRMDVPTYCYSYMFYGCTSLTQAPELPATTLASGCYNGMFGYCSSLTKAPALPATTLVSSCYYQMFRDCTSLTQAPELLVTTLASSCYRGMFSRAGISEFTVDMTACTSVPSLPSSTLFSDSTKPYTVLVPASLYDEWIAATNWSAIVDNIKAV